MTVKTTFKIENVDFMCTDVISSVEVIAASYLFADQETACHCQSMGEVVNAVGQKVQISTGLTHKTQ